jgi:hypothetical protein
MEMGASNKEAQVSATMAGVIWFVVMIHDFWTITLVYETRYS